MTLFRITAIFLIASITHFSIAQDLIITTQNDSLNCLIKKIEPEVIQFMYINQSGKKINSKISKSSLQYYKIGFFKDSKQVDNDAYRQSRTGLLWNLSYSYSYRLGEVDSRVPSNLSKKIKNGSAINLQFGYFYTNSIGFGVTYNVHFTKVAFDYNYVGTNYIGVDKTNIHFVAPSFFHKYAPLKSRFFYMSSLSAGILILNEYLDLNVNDVSLTGASLGVGYNGFLGVQVSDIIRLTAKFGVILGSLSKVNTNGSTLLIPSDQKENLSSITAGLSLGLLIK